MLACAFSFVFALFQVLEYGGLLSVSEQNASPVFLQILYWLQLLFGAGVLVFSIVTYVAIYTQHVRLMSGGCSMPRLFSRVLRYGMWLSLFAFFFVWFRSDEACDVVKRQGTKQIAAEACSCLQEERGTDMLPLEQSMCRPKSYHVCESPLADTIVHNPVEDCGDIVIDTVDHINKCRWCGLSMDGDVDMNGIIDHVPCTPQECTSMGCQYETKTCPPRVEDFDDEIDEVYEALRANCAGDTDATSTLLTGQQTDECRYDDNGRLTSLNLTASFDQPQSLVDYYLDTGVLRLTSGTDAGLEWALERGGWAIGNMTAVGLNSSAIAQGDCHVAVKQSQREVAILEHECWVIITTGNVMLNLLTTLISYHFSRVFYSLHLNDCAMSRGNTGHVRMDESGGLGGGGQGPPLHSRP